MNDPSSLTSLDIVPVHFPDGIDTLKRDGNEIIHYGEDEQERSCIIGEKMTSVCTVFAFTPKIISFCEGNISHVLTR